MKASSPGVSAKPAKPYRFMFVVRSAVVADRATEIVVLYTLFNSFRSNESLAASTNPLEAKAIPPA